MRYKLLAGTIAAAAIAYGGIWYTVALDTQRVIEASLEAMEDEGYRVNADGFEIGGFPYRIELTSGSVKLGTPGRGMAVEARDVTLFTHLWTPGQWAVKTMGSKISVAGGDLLVEDSETLGSWRMDGDAWRGSLALEDARMLRAPGLDRPANVAALELHIRKKVDKDSEAREGLYGEEVLAALLRVRGLIPDGAKQPTLTQAEFDMSLTGRGLDDWSRTSLETWRDEGGLLEVREMFVRWQGVDVRGNGSLTLDERLRPLGSFGLDISDPAALLQAADREDWIKGRSARDLVDELPADEGQLSLNLQGGELQALGYSLRELKPVVR